MGKKQYIQVAGNPLYKKPTSPNALIINPATNTKDFGIFPGFTCQHDVLPIAPIRLKYGEHKGEHQGYGLRHIWLQRFKSQTDPTQAEADVVQLLNKILVKGALIFYEGGTSNAERNRAVVCKSPDGLVILELRQDGLGNNFYSIVTTYAQNNPHGTEVATM